MPSRGSAGLARAILQRGCTRDRVERPFERHANARARLERGPPDTRDRRTWHQAAVQAGSFASRHLSQRRLTRELREQKELFRRRRLSPLFSHRTGRCQPALTRAARHHSACRQVSARAIAQCPPIPAHPGGLLPTAERSPDERSVDDDVHLRARRRDGASSISAMRVPVRTDVVRGRSACGHQDGLSAATTSRTSVKSLRIELPT